MGAPTMDEEAEAAAAALATAMQRNATLRTTYPFLLLEGVGGPFLRARLMKVSARSANAEMIPTIRLNNVGTTTRKNTICSTVTGMKNTAMICRDLTSARGAWREP